MSRRKPLSHMESLRDSFEVAPRSRISATSRPCSGIRWVLSHVSDFCMNAQSDAIIGPQHHSLPSWQCGVAGPSHTAHPAFHRRRELGQPESGTHHSLGARSPAALLPSSLSASLDHERHLIGVISTATSSTVPHAAPTVSTAALVRYFWRSR